MPTRFIRRISHIFFCKTFANRRYKYKKYSKIIKLRADSIPNYTFIPPKFTPCLPKIARGIMT